MERFLPVPLSLEVAPETFIFDTDTHCPRQSAWAWHPATSNNVTLKARKPIIIYAFACSKHIHRMYPTLMSWRHEGTPKFTTNMRRHKRVERASQGISLRKSISSKKDMWDTYFCTALSVSEELKWLGSDEKIIAATATLQRLVAFAFRDQALDMSEECRSD
jgi:hypothetical protein